MTFWHICEGVGDIAGGGDGEGVVGDCSEKLTILARQFSDNCYCRQVFDIGKGQHTPVTGLQYHSGSSWCKYDNDDDYDYDEYAVPGSRKYFLLATNYFSMPFKYCSYGDM